MLRPWHTCYSCAKGYAAAWVEARAATELQPVEATAPVLDANVPAAADGNVSPLGDDTLEL